MHSAKARLAGAHGICVLFACLLLVLQNSGRSTLGCLGEPGALEGPRRTAWLDRSREQPWKDGRGIAIGGVGPFVVRKQRAVAEGAHSHALQAGDAPSDWREAAWRRHLLAALLLSIGGLDVEHPGVRVGADRKTPALVGGAGQKAAFVAAIVLAAALHVGVLDVRNEGLCADRLLAVHGFAAARDAVAAIAGPVRTKINKIRRALETCAGSRVRWKVRVTHVNLTSAGLTLRSVASHIHDPLGKNPCHEECLQSPHLIAAVATSSEGQLHLNSGTGALKERVQKLPCLTQLAPLGPRLSGRQAPKRQPDGGARAAAPRDATLPLGAALPRRADGDASHFGGVKLVFVGATPAGFDRNGHPRCADSHTCAVRNNLLDCLQKSSLAIARKRARKCCVAHIPNFEGHGQGTHQLLEAANVDNLGTPCRQEFQRPGLEMLGCEFDGPGRARSLGALAVVADMLGRRVQRSHLDANIVRSLRDRDAVILGRHQLTRAGNPDVLLRVQQYDLQSHLVLERAPVLFVTLACQRPQRNSPEI
mmetsp:Transcript_39921/g.127960  ORF Transcript_39921/g.127960 Transcript_39921/m.127960 type:complete len:535 (-) Transcript_39921:198-1802(-)